MKRRNAGILASLLAIGALAAPMAAFAETTEVKIIYLDKAPPAAKPSVPTTPSKVGYVWSPGYWNWNGTDYAWTEGNWIAVVESKKWNPPTWTQEGTKWYFTAGYWS